MENESKRDRGRGVRDGVGKAAAQFAPPSTFRFKVVLWKLLKRSIKK